MFLCIRTLTFFYIFFKIVNVTLEGLYEVIEPKVRIHRHMVSAGAKQPKLGYKSSAECSESATLIERLLEDLRIVHFATHCALFNS